jgi:3-deoxy-7-phosphoheptulonate synthase
MRGGIFKPRSSPYSFQGLGIEGLKIFHHHCKKNDIKIITEVMDTSGEFKSQMQLYYG